MAHLVKNAEAFTVLNDYFLSQTFSPTASLDTIYKTIFENYPTTFIDFVKCLADKGYESALYFLQKSSDWNSPELSSSLKKSFPYEALIFDALANNLPSLNSFYLGIFSNENVSYRTQVDNNSLSLHIYPPSIETTDEEGYVSIEYSDLKDSLPKIIEALTNLGFTKEALDKVRNVLSATPSPSTYAINLDEHLQAAIFNKNFGSSKAESVHGTQLGGKPIREPGPNQLEGRKWDNELLKQLDLAKLDEKLKDSKAEDLKMNKDLGKVSPKIKK
jgi:hypothetical protein